MQDRTGRRPDVFRRKRIVGLIAEEYRPDPRSLGDPDQRAGVARIAHAGEHEHHALTIDDLIGEVITT